jgi:hypothetical protein
MKRFTPKGKKELKNLIEKLKQYEHFTENTSEFELKFKKNQCLNLVDQFKKYRMNDKAERAARCVMDLQKAINKKKRGGSRKRSRSRKRRSKKRSRKRTRSKKGGRKTRKQSRSKKRSRKRTRSKKGGRKTRKQSRSKKRSRKR